MISRLKKLEKCFQVKIKKSLKAIFINPGETIEGKTKNLNKKDYLLIEYTK